MKLLYLVCFLYASMQGAQQAPSAVERAQNFYQAVRFFRIISQVPPDVVSNFLPRLATFRTPGSLILFDIWNAIPDNARTGDIITVRIEGETTPRHTISCPVTMHRDLQRVLAPLYSKESEKILQAIAQGPAAESVKHTVLEYLQPMSKKEVDTLDFTNINTAHLYAYNILGTRAYWQKVFKARNRLQGALESILMHEDVRRSRPWDDAIRKNDVPKQREILESLTDSVRQAFTVHLGKSATEYIQAVHGYQPEQPLDAELVLRCEKVVIDTVCVRGSGILSLGWHQDLVRLAPRATKIWLSFGSPADLETLLLNRYAWPQLKEVTFHECDEVSESPALQVFRERNPSVKVHITNNSDSAGWGGLLGGRW